MTGATLVKEATFEYTLAPRFSSSLTPHSYLSYILLTFSVHPLRVAIEIVNILFVLSTIWLNDYA